MTAFSAFVLGLLAGWLVEWLVDWWYWRKRFASLEDTHRRLAQEHADCKSSAAAKQVEIDRLAQEHADCKSSAAAKQVEIDRLIQENAALKAENARLQPAIPDDLKIIKGIGPEIERRLNKAGIVTFTQLGALNPAGLEAILGDVIRRLANEDDLLEQARQLSQHKS